MWYSTAIATTTKKVREGINDLADNPNGRQFDKTEFEDLDESSFDASRSPSLLTLCARYFASKLLKERDSPLTRSELVAQMDAILPDELLLHITQEFLKQANSTRREKKNCYKVSRSSLVSRLVSLTK